MNTTMNASKKIVHYQNGAALIGPPENLRAWLQPVDHPDTDNVDNGSTARTSPVIAYDLDSGLIETERTIYMPVGEVCPIVLNGVPA